MSPDRPRFVRPGRHRGRPVPRPRLTAVLLTTGAALLVVACGQQLRATSDTEVTARPTGASASGASTGTGPRALPVRDVPAPRETPRPAPRPAEPTRVDLPSLGVSAPVEPVDAPDGVLIPPADPGRLGWWAEGALPGAARGSALIAGHTVHDGAAPLNELERVAPGDRVRVGTRRGPLAYRVTDVEVLTKGRLADRAQAIFSQEVPGRLILLTCEDWDGTQYLSNVVVTAERVRR